tara:strand:+ start:342 stop:590 length:249 start_codon:yes stop_codon:yes gene_type:complete
MLAFKLAAAASIIGSTVSEISIGLRGGVGRQILLYGQQTQTDLPKMYCAIIGAGFLGLAFTSAIGSIERTLPGSSHRAEQVS